VILSRKLLWAGHGEDTYTHSPIYILFVKKLIGKRPFEKPGRRYVDNNGMNIRVIALKD
jgi:hypothetical protein